MFGFDFPKFSKMDVFSIWRAQLNEWGGHVRPWEGIPAGLSFNGAGLPSTFLRSQYRPGSDRKWRIAIMDTGRAENFAGQDLGPEAPTLGTPLR